MLPETATVPANWTPSERMKVATPAGLTSAVTPSPLSESLPLDDDRRLELHIEVSFWARAISDEESATEHLRSHDTWRAAIASSVRECVELGEIGPCDVLEVADTLVALVDGLGVDALMHPERLPAERQRLVVRRELERLRTSTDHENPVRESRRRRVAGARTRVDDAG